MPIAVTPFVFLLNLGMGLGMCGMFLGYSAHERMGPPLASGVARLDAVNISLAVIITSLFLVWSGGSLLGGYFGDYAMFRPDVSGPFETIEKIDILVDIFQKALEFCVLGLVSFQSTKIGDRETLVPWGKCCVAMGALQALLLAALQCYFKGLLGVLLACVLSALLNCVIMMFSLLTALTITAGGPAGGVRGYFSQRISGWNLRVCLGVLAASLLDFSARTFFAVVEIQKREPYQLFVDVASLCKCLALFLIVALAYSARIPKSKAYSIND